MDEPHRDEVCWQSGSSGPDERAALAKDLERNFPLSKRGLRWFFRSVAALMTLSREGEVEGLGIWFLLWRRDADRVLFYRWGYCPGDGTRPPPTG